MFDLFRSREKSVRILLGALLVLVALSMLTYLVPNYDRGGNTAESVVATVAGQDVTVGEINKIIRNALQGSQLQPELVPTYVPMIVDEVVTERALAYQAAKMGLQVTDNDVRQTIQTMMPELFPDGKFAGKDAYASVLASRQTTIEEFESDLRRRMLITKLRDIAIQGTVVSEREIEREFQLRNEKIKLEFVKLTPDQFKNAVQPSNEDLQALYNASKSRYMQPEKKNLVILIADQAKIAASLNPTDAELHKMYDRNLDSMRLPERVQIKQILFKTQGKPEADDAKIKAQAEGVLKQIQGGASFADLAKKDSEDTTTADKGGELGWIQRGQTLPDLEKAAFSMKPGETSLVKTSIGYHIIQVEAHDQAHVQSFDEAKDKLTAGYKSALVNSIMQHISDEAQTMLQKDPLHPDQVAEQLHMDVVHADNVAPGGEVPVIGTNGDFDQSIAGLKQGQVSQVVQVPGNKLVMAEVTGIVPARVSTFDEALPQMRETLTKSREDKKMRDTAQQLAEKAKASGDLVAAAKSLGLTVTTSDDFARQGSVPGLGSADYVREEFDQPVGTVFGPKNIPEAVLVGKVIAHVPADMSQLAAQRDTIRDQIKGARARQRNTLFEAGVHDEMIKQGKLKYHQDVIDRLIAQYRTS
jgi:peptidyl-prolyl cis-trans isomerase D